MDSIRFNRPYITGKEIGYIKEVIEGGRTAGGGIFTDRCHDLLQSYTGCHRAFLTHSCTGGLEMAAILADIRPGDEVIMPSFTFTSTANAFVLRGGVPVFVDIRADTLNIDEAKIEEAITRRTKAIVPVHYAGVSCEMSIIMDIARNNELIVIEDAAQAIRSSYKGAPLGSIGHMSIFSFHATKNISSGQGGALMLNDQKWEERAEIVWHKGSDRARFFRGEVDKYTWCDLGSSFLPSELISAYLFAQLEELESITDRRMEIWTIYHTAFEELEYLGYLRRPFCPLDCRHNGHTYYIIVENLEYRTTLLEKMKEAGIHAVFHYVPLHSSQAGRRFGLCSGELKETDRVSDCLIRLPMWIGMGVHEIGRVVKVVERYLK